METKQHTNLSNTSSFLGKDFLLENEYASQLYHEYAKDLPIIDYHNHLIPEQVAGDRQFENITQIWLKGDHYKWRAMRAFGVDEKYITGDASDWEKFEKWAETLPYTLRNPLYHWSHLELKRYFGIDELLTKDNARQVYGACNDQLAKREYSVLGLLKKMKVEVVCTTDDPTDDLRHHQQAQSASTGIKMLPTFRPDKSLQIERSDFTDYIKKLSEAASMTIDSFDSLQQALTARMDFFQSLGCCISDHGLEQIPSADFDEKTVDAILKRRLSGQTIFAGEAVQYQSALLLFLGKSYHQRGWTQQFHLGALRDTNTRLLSSLGPDTGFDSIGDLNQAVPLSRFLDRLDHNNQLAKTILYNLNPRDNEVFATMVGNYNDGTIKGKMQYGSGWWFLDQLDGMEKQIEALSNMGLLSQFVGMLTDSRSFLSFPRHEYFRRLLCNIFGRDIQRGRLPKDLTWTGKIVQDICYHNAKNYFNF